MKMSFITKIKSVLQNDTEIILHSRAYGKYIAHYAKHQRLDFSHNPWLRLWAPKRLIWWSSIFFIIGSSLFGFGSFASNWKPIENINLIFFIGSLFFTTAAVLQVLNSVKYNLIDIIKPKSKWQNLLQNAGFLSATTQFIGTILFNFNTANASIPHLTWLTSNIFIWTPDVLGSILFLVSSFLAVIEISHGRFFFNVKKVEFWIVLLNLIGSIAFMLSAIFAYTSQESGALLWEWGANTWTFVGAVCFFLASYLMLPELFGVDMPHTLKQGYSNETFSQTTR